MTQSVINIEIFVDLTSNTVRGKITIVIKYKQHCITVCTCTNSDMVVINSKVSLMCQMNNKY